MLQATPISLTVSSFDRMLHAAQPLDTKGRESDGRNAVNWATNNRKASGLYLADPMSHPLDAHLSDPFIDRMSYRRLGGCAAKLAKDGQQLYVADLWRKRRRFCQSRLPQLM
jgi:hypothetical protein